LDDCILLCENLSSTCGNAAAPCIAVVSGSNIGTIWRYRLYRWTLAGRAIRVADDPFRALTNTPVPNIETMAAFTPHQDTALKAVADWLRARPGERGTPQVFRLFGFAGTGKTTLARHIAEGVEGEVKYAAFTGKAALVMRNKGCDGASTIHSLIYRARETRDEQPTFELWDDAPASKAKLIVIDECSMVDAELGSAVLSWSWAIRHSCRPSRVAGFSPAPSPTPCSPKCTGRRRTIRSCGCRWMCARGAQSRSARMARPKWSAAASSIRPA
jgi:hypothetical protein